MESYTSLDAVDRIATLGEPVLRNLQITQSYYELSTAVAQRSGPCANWCTFATWASRQAGQTIRHEDLARALEDMLKTGTATGFATDGIAEVARMAGAPQQPEDIRRLIWEAIDPRAAMQRSGDAVARGNQKVYAEIGREFARFDGACLADADFDAANIERFCAALRPGGPPDGQQYLRQAFPRYYRAFFEPDPKKKAEHILLANLEIGFHEQTRLQPEIAEALDASLPDPKVFLRRLIYVLFPNRGWLIYAGSWMMRLLGKPTRLEEAANRFFDSVRQKIRLFLTDHLMQLRFPHGRHLRLGDDLSASFPPVLRQLASADLIALLQRVDPTPDSTRETGAIDWADLPERMHFIADLFRCYHEAPDLLEAPFTTAQTEAIKAGRVPEGEL